MHLPGNGDHLIKTDVSTVSSVSASSCLLVVPWGLQKFLRSRRYHSIWACLLWMISFTVSSDPSNHQLPWWCHHQPLLQTDPGASLGGRADMVPTSPLCTSLYDSDLVGVEFRRHGGGRWCQNNVDFWWPKGSSSLPPPSWKCCQSLFTEDKLLPILNMYAMYSISLSYINRWRSSHLHK